MLDEEETSGDDAEGGRAGRVLVMLFGVAEAVCCSDGDCICDAEEAFWYGERLGVSAVEVEEEGCCATCCSCCICGGRG